MLKTITKAGREWMWPEYDEKLLQVFDQVDDITTILNYVENYDICIQAGGACGVWPSVYAKYFKKVYTFEPDPVNHDCLIHNTLDYDNIIISEAAISNTESIGKIVRDDFEKNNCGAGYFMEGDGSVNTVSIDSLNIDSCGLIQLDVEGYELEALYGATKTIMKYCPTIVLEEKPLPHMKRDYKLPRKLLESYGYKEVGRIHRDVIFKC